MVSNGVACNGREHVVSNGAAYNGKECVYCNEKECVACNGNECVISNHVACNYKECMSGVVSNISFINAKYTTHSVTTILLSSLSLQKRMSWEAEIWSWYLGSFCGPEFIFTTKKKSEYGLKKLKVHQPWAKTNYSTEVLGLR